MDMDIVHGPVYAFKFFGCHDAGISGDPPEKSILLPLHTWHHRNMYARSYKKHLYGVYDSPVAHAVNWDAPEPVGDCTTGNIEWAPGFHCLHVTKGYAIPYTQCYNFRVTGIVSMLGEVIECERYTYRAEKIVIEKLWLDDIRFSDRLRSDLQDRYRCDVDGPVPPDEALDSARDYVRSRTENHV